MHHPLLTHPHPSTSPQQFVCAPTIHHPNHSEQERLSPGPDTRSRGISEKRPIVIHHQCTTDNLALLDAHIGLCLVWSDLGTQE